MKSLFQTNKKWVLAVITLTMLLSVFVIAPASAFTNVFINEIHYDNSGTDLFEGVEVAGPAGTDLAGWAIVLYDGSSGLQYATMPLSGNIPDLENGYGVLVFYNEGIEDGAPDGLALVDSSGGLVQFLSYEGSFEALDGPAVGETSTDIGVFEPTNTAYGNSLQLTGMGLFYEDFSWTGSITNTFGQPNLLQSFINTGSCPGAIPIASVQGTGDGTPYAGQKVTVSGVVTADFGAEIMIQDDTTPFSGIVVFSYINPAEQGDRVCVSGVAFELDGQTQIGGNGYANASIVVLSSGNTLPDPAVMASGDLTSGSPSAEQWEAMLVRVENAAVTNADLGFGEFAVDDGSGPAIVDDKGTYSYTPTNGDILNYVQGPLNFVSGSYKIVPRNDADISLQENEPPAVCTDITPPVIELIPSTQELWPANHKYVTVTVDAKVFDDTDPNPSFMLFSVISNEPDNGLGDGDTPNDIFIYDDFTFDLRAERSGKGDGRVYTITYSAVDTCGNETFASVQIFVPHDARPVVAGGSEENSDDGAGKFQNGGSQENGNQNTENNGGSDDGPSSGGVDGGSVSVNTCDSDTPTLKISASTLELWPANHKYVTVEFYVDASDNSGEPPTVTLFSVVSNEPDDGLGDGDFPDDIVIIDDFTIDLRAERSGTGEGRVYTITYSVEDDCGNVTFGSIEVFVPHNKENGPKK